MLGPNTLKLLGVGSSQAGARVGGSRPPAPGRLGAELAEFLDARNGWYAFESALHVFGSGIAAEGDRTLEQWNSPGGWRRAYGSLAEGYVFFAEDAFGGQFGIFDDMVYTFDPETGESESFASSIEDWADQLLGDYEVLTAYPLAHEWQQAHGPLHIGQRLLPKMPFVLGGEFSVDNLYALDADQGMRLRGDLARQLLDLPDGATVRYGIAE